MNNHKDISALKDSLKNFIEQKMTPLCLLMDKDYQLKGWYGNLSDYNLDDIAESGDCISALPFLVGFDILEPTDFPFMELPGQSIVHVRVLPFEDDLQIIIANAEHEHQLQQAQQQNANELQIADYRRKQAMDELEVMQNILKEKNVELEKANELKSRFIAGMSHEFRTPLAAVIGYANLLLESRDEKVIHHSRGVLRSAQHLLSIIDNILEQARMDAGELVVQAVPTDLSELMIDLQAIFLPIAERKGLDFSFKHNHAFPDFVAVDAVRLRQVCINLVGNATKFTDNGFVHVLFEWHKDILGFSVSDSGPGISKEAIDNLFVPFQRAQESKQGAGLGLAITKQLIERMGGELTVDSTVGKGSCFSFKLPVPTVNVPKTEPILKQESVEKNESLKIVLAEDEDFIAEFMNIYLANAGHEVIRARDGYEAVSAVKTHQPDVVLVDMHMPKLDGYEAAAQMRESGCDKPIIVLSASSSSKDRQRALAAGCNLYLVKPVDISHLLSVIQNMAANH